MTPTTPRKKTAKEMADELGVSVSTITRKYAVPRDEYIAAARAREDEALRLKEVEELTDHEVAERMSTSDSPVTYYAAIGLIKRARKRRDLDPSN
jgi:Trp operon repressor